MAARSRQRWMMMLGNVGLAICISYALLSGEIFGVSVGDRFAKNLVIDMPQPALTVLQQLRPASSKLFQEKPKQCNWTSTIVSCPRSYAPIQQATAGDPLGTLPLLCTTNTVDPQDDKYHVFNVSCCKGSQQLQLKVTHLDGFAYAPVNRLYTTGPDLITVQIVGPELRLTPLTYTCNGVYDGVVRAAIPGEYTFDITVGLTPELVGGPNRPFWTSRNLLLAVNETWVASEVAAEEIVADKQETRLTAMGRWVSMAEHPKAQTAMMPKTKVWMAHRCTHVGEYSWTPNVFEEPPALKTRAEVLACMRSVKLRRSQSSIDAKYSRILMVRDSQTRNTFNALLNLVWPDNQEIRAEKDFKSLSESQCFGGNDQGFELCFQWANVGPENNATLAHYLETFDRVTINWGQHMVYRPHQSLKGWEKEFTPRIIPFARTIHEIPGALERIIWLQTHIFPLANGDYFVGNSDRRKLPLLLDMLTISSGILERLQLPELKLLGILLPYHDCSVDGAHFTDGLPETIVRDKILPWLCPAGDHYALKPATGEELGTGVPKSNNSAS